MKTKGNSRYNLTLQLYFPFSLWFAYWLCGSVSASLKVHKFKGKVKANTIKKECCVFFSLKSPSQSHECRYNTQSDFSGMKVITCLLFIYLCIYDTFIHFESKQDKKWERKPIAFYLINKKVNRLDLVWVSTQLNL